MSPDLFRIVGPWRGRMAIVTRPRGGDWLEDEISAWRQAGIDVVVSLLESDEAEQLDLADERKAAEAHGIRYISFPIPDRGVPASESAAISLLTGIVRALDKGKNVAVHCRQGIGRSGLIAVGVLISSGMGAEDAIKAVSAARRLTVPETPEQLEWVRGLRLKPSVMTR